MGGRVYTRRPVDQRLTATLSIMVTEPFVARLDRVAAAWGQQRSDFCRMALEEVLGEREARLAPPSGA